MRANAVVEGNVASYFMRGDIDDGDVRTVSAGLSDAGVAVDGHEGEFAVGGGYDFVARDAAFGDRGEHSAAGGINDGEALGAFFGDEKAALREPSRNKTCSHCH